MEENTYRIIYKNGNTIETKAYSMVLADGKLYQCCRAYPFDNGTMDVLDGSKIERIEQIR